MREGTSSQAGTESRCRHFMGDMQREAKTLWDSLGLAGRLSEQSPSRGGELRVFPICRLSSKVVSHGGGVGGWGVVGGWEMDHRKREAEICGKSGSR